MESYWVLFTLFAICLPLQCMAASLNRVDDGDKTKKQFGTDDVGFTISAASPSLQSWSDWLKKRSFGGFPFGDPNIQAWREWMDKRGLRPGSSVGPQFGSSDSFQQWQDWMNKRGGSHNNAEAFQSWQELLNKRSLLGTDNSGAIFGQPRVGNFQSWRDYSKRGNFELNNPAMDFVSKRSFGMTKPTNPFSVRFGSYPNLMKWDDMMKRSGDKRQLGSSPASFGHSKQYFTDGLQDWRHAFPNSKRVNINAKSKRARI